MSQIMFTILGTGHFKRAERLLCTIIWRFLNCLLINDSLIAEQYIPNGRHRLFLQKNLSTLNYNYFHQGSVTF